MVVKCRMSHQSGHTTFAFLDSECRKSQKPGHTTLVHPESWKAKGVCHMMWHTTFYHNTFLKCTHILWTYVLGTGTYSQDTAPIFTYIKI